MANSFTSPPVLVDPARVTAGLTIRSEEASRLADVNNYAFAHLGTANVISQAWRDEVFQFDNTSMTDVCEWVVPRPSAEHVELKLRLMAFTSVAGGQAKVTVTSPISGHSDTTTITITDTSRFQSAFSVITVAISSVEQETIAEVKLSLQAASGGLIEVSGVQASWTPLTTPLTVRALDQYSDDAEFIPMGTTRMSADLPLTSRAGVDLITNQTMLKRRGRVLFSWSGVSESRVVSSEAAAKGLGVFDSQLLFSEAVLFDGMTDAGLDIDLYFYVENYDVADPLRVVALGYYFTMTQAGWNSFNVPIRTEELTRSTEFRLPMYKTGLDESRINTTDLLSDSRRVVDGDPYISAFMIVGV